MLQCRAPPFVSYSVIKHMVRLETAVNVCVGRLQERLRRITAESHSDDVSRESDSAIVSSRIISDGLHLLGNGRERDLLAQIKTLEMENEALKKRLNMVGNA